MNEPLAEDDLGGQILWCPAYCPSPLVNFLRKAKVGDLDMASIADQQVLRLQIPVNDVLRVQVFPGENDLRGEKPGNIIRKPDSVIQLFFRKGEEVGGGKT